MSVSVVIPVFNDTTMLMELVQRLYQVSDPIGDRIELLLVDDGSTPDTWEHLKALKTSLPGHHIILLRLAENSGQHNATLCGLIHAQGSIMVTMDADLQHPPEAIPLLLARLREHQLDLVYGTALAGHPWVRRIASRLFKLLTHRLGSPRIDGSAFRAMKASLARPLIDNENQPFTIIDTVLQGTAARMETLPVEHHVRRHGRSGYTWKRLFIMALHVIAEAPEFPRLLLLLAVCMAVPGMVLLAFDGGMMPPHTIASLRGPALLLGGLFLLFVRQKVALRSALSGLKPRFRLREKIE
jgi:undecaprenyl-phosphate 4-deoxy-4-formamido-L-arabinose transferase